jgi:FkbM family methyltransferase
MTVRLYLAERIGRQLRQALGRLLDLAWLTRKSLRERGMVATVRQILTAPRRHGLRAVLAYLRSLKINEHPQPYAPPGERDSVRVKMRQGARPFRIHTVIQWKGIELIIRAETVDRENVDWMGESLFWKLFEERSIGSGDVVLDLGAHIGSFGILASHSRGCRVVAFEPDRESMRLCRANALLNGLEGRFEFVEAVVGGSDCTVQLYEALENWGHTIFSSGGPHNLLTGKSVDVPCYSLKKALEVGKCDFCAFVKVNIEGAEFDMIEMADEETLSRVGALAAEVHYDLVKRSPEHMISKLKRANFSVHLEPAGERAILLAWR